MASPLKSGLFLICLLVLAGAGLLGSLYVGPARLAVTDLLLGRPVDPRERMMILDLRLPRAVLALLVGSGLALAGTLYQGLFRNPLADPFVVGTSGGAALGAVVAGLFLSGATFAGLSIGNLAAFGGATGTAWLVYRLAATHGRVPLTSLLLAGFAVGMFASSCVTIILLYHSRNWNEVLQWLMGHLSHASWTRVRVVLPLMAVAFLLALAYAKDLNLLLFGEESAQQLGSDVERAKKVLLVAGSLATATAVAAAGIVGFVGLIVPHLARFMVGPDHRRLLPTAFLSGGVILLFADVVARLAWPPLGLPVGAVTALLGPPFFILLMRRHQLKRSSGI